MNIELSKIRIDGGTQSRLRIINEAVSEYAEAIKRGDSLPPITVFFDGVDHWLADGFHRYHGTKSAGASTIAATVINGDKRAAILFSVGANDTHGLRRTNDDKRKAVMTLLGDAEWAKWSDRKIAEQCRVHHEMVGRLRADHLAVPPDSQPETRTVERGGTVYQQKVAKARKPTEAHPAVAAERAALALPAASEPEDDGAPSQEEIDAALAQDAADREVFDKLLAADDKLAEAYELLKQQNAVIAGLKARIAGLQNECNAAKRKAKHWQKQAGRAAA